MHALRALLFCFAAKLQAQNSSNITARKAQYLRYACNMLLYKYLCNMLISSNIAYNMLISSMLYNMLISSMLQACSITCCYTMHYAYCIVILLFVTYCYTACYKCNVTFCACKNSTLLNADGHDVKIRISFTDRRSDVKF